MWGTGERGFIIMGRDNYLEPNHLGLQAVPGDEVRGVAIVGAAADKLSALVAERLKEAQEPVQLRLYQMNFYPLRTIAGATEGVGLVIAGHQGAQKERTQAADPTS